MISYAEASRNERNDLSCNAFLHNATVIRHGLESGTHRDWAKITLLNITKKRSQIAAAPHYEAKCNMCWSCVSVTCKFETRYRSGQLGQVSHEPRSFITFSMFIKKLLLKMSNESDITLSTISKQSVC